MKHATWLGLAILAASTATHAGPYIAGSATLSDRKDSPGAETDSAVGGKISAGYRWEGLPLMFELSYFDTGEADIKNTFGGEGSYSGVQASLGYFGRLDSKGSGLWATGGYYSGDTEVKDPGGVFPFPNLTSKESTSGLVLGVGGVWKVTPYFGLQAGADMLFGVEDFAEKEDMLVLHAGVVFELPGAAASSSRSSYTPPPAPVPTPAPVPAHTYTPTPAAVPPEPAAAPAPAPQLSLTPAASVVAVPASAKPAGMPVIGIRYTAQPTALLRQPRAGSPVDARLASGTEVQLMQRVPNALGIWWYIYANGISGWVNDSALAPQ